MNNYREIEFKYRADNISLEKFEVLCKEMKYKQAYTASGFDKFYKSSNNKSSFGRVRLGDIREITIKLKDSEKNNFKRDEVNIPVDFSLSAEEMESAGDAFFTLAGFKYSGKVFKNCFIYNFDLHTFVYYICYDENMKEVGRFLEVELSQKFDWPNEYKAWEYLLDVEEDVLTKLGITHKNRVKNSLFEMFGGGK